MPAMWNVCFSQEKATKEAEKVEQWISRDLLLFLLMICFLLFSEEMVFSFSVRNYTVNSYMLIFLKTIKTT